MFYIEKDDRIVLFSERIEEIQNNLIVMPQYQGLEIKETSRPIKDFQFADTEEYIQEQIRLRSEQFQKDFFQTSLGWVRRKVTMKTGEIKDFLTDLLPTIAVASMMGKTANVLTYREPDFTQEEVDWEALQEVHQADMTFITECANQTDTDFTGVIHALVEPEEEVEGNAFEEEDDLDDLSKRGNKVGIYKGSVPLVSNTDEVEAISRDIGEIFYSSIPLKNANYHLADGSKLSSEGIYSDFVSRMRALYNANAKVASNIYKQGAVVDTNNVLSNFSADNYAVSRPFFSPGTRTWEVVVKFNGDTSSNSNTTVIAAGYSWAINTNGVPRLYLSSDGATWDIANNVAGVTSLQNNTDYWYKLVYNGSSYILYLSTTGTFSGEETTEVTISPSGGIATLDVVYSGNRVCIGKWKSNYPTFFNGSVDLNETYINIGGLRWWNGTSPAGFMDESSWQATLTSFNACGKLVYSELDTPYYCWKYSGTLPTGSDSVYTLCVPNELVQDDPVYSVNTTTKEVIEIGTVKKVVSGSIDIRLSGDTYSVDRYSSGDTVISETSARLPKINDVPEDTVDVKTLGEVIKAGLPAILDQSDGAHAHGYTIGNESAHTHSRGTWEISGSFQGGKSSSTVSGVFTRASGQDTYKTGTANMYTVSFNASNSGTWTGATSGGSDHNHTLTLGNIEWAHEHETSWGSSLAVTNTVQPETTKVLVYIVVSSVPKTTDINTSSVQSSLNNKLNSNFSNVQFSDSTERIFRNLCLPSTRYIDLTLASEGDTFTAPANGYFCCGITGTTNDVYMELNHSGNKMRTVAVLLCPAYMPVRKGDLITSYYGGSGFSVQFFRFVYAEGEV